MSSHDNPIHAEISNAVKIFWETRSRTLQRQPSSKNPDSGERRAATAGKNMDGFLELLSNTVKAHGSPDLEVRRKFIDVVLPGYFRPTKHWDFLVLSRNVPIVAELKSQVGPSFGNNFNNRVEEALGSAVDLWTAVKKGKFEKPINLFLGWLILVEDCEKSRKPVHDLDPSLPGFKKFLNTSYLERYEIMCQLLMKEKIYDAAALVTTVLGDNRKREFRTLYRHLQKSFEEHKHRKLPSKLISHIESCKK